MARKKKKDKCPYCGRMFVYLSRHKCKVKKRLEGGIEEKSVAERRRDRIKEKKKQIKRPLKKEEKNILEIINEEERISFNDLLKKTGKRRDELEEIVDILELKSKVKINRELRDAAWTKVIQTLGEYEGEMEFEVPEYDKKDKAFIWKQFGKQPCFICPFTGRCSGNNPEIFNPHHCPWLTEWIKVSLGESEQELEEFNIDFDKISHLMEEDKLEVR